MPWQYSQQTGRLTRNGQAVGTGYSGHGTGLNNPLIEGTQNVGAIPRGRYRIGPQYTHSSKGPVALTPIGHLARGRTHFLIHGDSIRHPGGASEGCIVLNRAVRQAIAGSSDTQILVVQ